MRHSIRTKISLMIFACSLCMVAAIIFMNTVFLDKYYLKGKEQSFEEAYDIVNESLGEYLSGDMGPDKFRHQMEMISARSGISIMLINNDWSIYYASMRNVDEFVNRLQNSLFNKILTGENLKNVDGVRTVVAREDYAIYEIYNPQMDDTYLELIGNTEDGKLIYMTLAVKSIQENVAISNRFIIQIGLVVAVIAAFAAFMIGTLIARPIKELSVIAEKMSELDFNAVYERDDKSEIGHLGNSMNKLSNKLESTISELKSANVELQKDIETKEQADEMRKEFLSNVSHELKTPIALIQGYAEGLKEGITDDPESTQFYCDVIVDEASKMNTMVKKLLSLNQLEFGNQQLEMERFNLMEVICAVADANKLLAEQKGIEILLEGEKNIEVWADEYKVEEVITNYLTNAINHCEDKMQIKISVREQDGIARISVFNTGNPIPEEEMENIWEKFYKVDKARTREYGGNGIGLSIVKAIMEQHKQQYGVTNHGDGVEFWFELDAKK